MAHKYNNNYSNYYSKNQFDYVKRDNILTFFVIITIIMIIMFIFYLLGSNNYITYTDWNSLQIYNQSIDNTGFEAEWFYMPIDVYLGYMSIEHQEIAREVLIELENHIPGIDFNEKTEYDSQIEIVFYDYAPLELESIYESELTYTSGYSISEYYPRDEIVSAEVYVFPRNECQFYNVLFHELLHTFGIGHDDDYGTIMSVYGYGYSNCKKLELDTEIINYLNEIYH